MRGALAVARTGLDLGEMPIGAVVVVDDEIVAAAHTQELTSGRLLVHADLLALRSCRHGHLRSSRTIHSVRQPEPCMMCLGAAFTAKVGTVVYELESPSDGGVSAIERWDQSRDSNAMPGYHLPEIRGGVLPGGSRGPVPQVRDHHSGGKLGCGLGRRSGSPCRTLTTPSCDAAASHSRRCGTS